MDGIIIKIVNFVKEPCYLNLCTRIDLQILLLKFNFVYISCFVNISNKIK